MSIRRNDFDRLTAAFWPLMGADKVMRAFTSYEQGTRGVEDHAFAPAVDWFIEQGDKMPLPADLRRKARALSSTGEQTGGRGMVRCVGRDKPCNTLFPVWTDCPQCSPSGSRLPRESVSFRQCAPSEGDDLALAGLVPTPHAPSR